MSREFVARILEPTHQRLQHIEINNLMQWSDADPPLPPFDSLQDLETHLTKVALVQVLPRTRLMAGALDPLIDCCSNLTSLRITTIGQYEGFTAHQNSRDDRMYESWARLLNSVRSHLRKFSFEQGVDRLKFERQAQQTTSRTSRSFINKMRPMDQLFVDWLLPVLLEAKWPEMRRMEIRGVGRCTKTYYHMWRPPVAQDMSEEDAIYDLSRRFGVGDWEVKVTRIAFTSRAKEKLKSLIGEASLILDEESEHDYEDLVCEDIGLIK
ncbi:hypothetical protein CC86DRAFT_63425 [Ophiobolus disseminans]|uniref:Uncharacterized protein n=1 Tax=Ophiobolus disseminans TaxID=1469910 RepID=A0A6A6ZT93_9PLEO|nr:hypothetical protein CC86DRAFT_63425 [Ophiobolus disseminans]